MISDLPTNDTENPSVLTVFSTHHDYKIMSGVQEVVVKGKKEGREIERERKNEKKRKERKRKTGKKEERKKRKYWDKKSIIMQKLWGQLTFSWAL